MPVVLGTQQVAGRMQPKSKWYQDLGRIQGRAADILLQAYLTGQASPGQQAGPMSPQYPGQLTFPSGASTSTSPDELAQIRAMGGVPNQQGGVTPLRPGGVTYTPPPQINDQLKLLQIQQAQQSLDPNSPLNRQRSAIAAAYGAAGMTPQPASAGGLMPDALLSIADRADAGDDEAIRVMEYLMSVQGGL